MNSGNFSSVFIGAVVAISPLAQLSKGSAIVSISVVMPSSSIVLAVMTRKVEKGLTQEDDKSVHGRGPHVSVLCRLG